MYLAGIYASHVLGHDQGWYLYAAQRVLVGIQLYGPLLTETNPPLIVWFSAVPALVAHECSLSIAVALHTVTLALAFASAGWCAYILRRVRLGLPATQRLVFLAALFLIETNVIAFDIGQREQLLVVLVLPLLIAVAMGVITSVSSWESAALGFAAGVGVCFKPQQVFVLLSILVGVIISTSLRGFLRSSIWLAVLGTAAAFLLYFASIVVFAPLYLREVVPVLADTYWAFGPYTMWSLVRTQHHFFLTLLFATLVYTIGRRRRMLSLVSGFLLLASTGAWLSYAIQHAGFFYHRIPEDAFLKLAIVSMVIEVGASLLPTFFLPPAPTRRQSAAAIVLVAVLSIVRVRQVHSVELLNQLPSSTVQGFLHTLPAGTVVWSLDTSLGTHFPEVLTDKLVWGSRFAHLWMVPALQQNEAMHLHGPRAAKTLTPEIVVRLANLQRQSSSQDLERWRPAFVTVPSCNQLGDCQGIVTPGFDLLAWFKQSPDFAREWKAYRPKGSLVDIHTGTHFDLYEHR